MKYAEKKLIIGLHLMVFIFWILVFVIPSHFGFLIWNVFLALLPLDFAIVYRRLAMQRKKWFQWLVFLCWLCFFPNAMYLLTDFSHLSAIGTGLANTAQYLNYGFLFTGVMLGMLIGLSSLEIMQASLPLKKRSWRVVFYVVIAFISAFAMYLGRFARINSWDILTNLHGILTQIQMMMGANMFIFILVFGLTQLMIFSVYHLIWENH
ncbi:DUF1361 domain-containing protein [Weissella diestrammenae]|uniref:DUF1361 domain-containing protein n=1 Tax=Weissella diestrammenae TaxID=1162633 RepID=A0A7G9T3X4_9LACO|nr:DUF1361 domain-containing protein [Weissella diestrammenae]MCM0582126.1 DUF1361 domain-containing protein [Weissella diestrammenae]QNN74799.1 DUF1361 domain-containing protein [Weissella diestrammenae]